MNFHCSLIGNLRHVQGRFLTTCETYRETLTLLSHSFFTYKMEKWYLIYPPQRLIVSSQSVSSVAQSCLTLCNPMACSTSGFSVHHQLPELAQTHVHSVGDAIQPSHPLFPLLLQSSIFPSIRVFSNESVFCIRWPKYWSFSFNIFRTDFLRMDWFDLLAVKGTFKSLL